MKKRPPGRPPKHDQPMPIRSIRCDAALWEAARQAAEAKGETITDAITGFLRRYVARGRTDRSADGDQADGLPPSAG